MPKPKITIGAERFLNQDKYRMTLIEVESIEPPAAIAQFAPELLVWRFQR